MIINDLNTLYKGHFLGDNEVVLTIQLNQPSAGLFYKTFLEIIPIELKTELTYEFVDQSDGIVVSGTKERIKELDDFLLRMKDSMVQQDINGVIVSESFSKYIRDGINENSLQGLNVYKCMKCGKIEIFDNGSFPLVRPYMCPLCGSYMFQKKG
jgi:DNA-directed RNA polymerase subunit RPC12/RpoP